MPTKSQKSDKKGGSLMSDVNKLVVPFGILLAERGLQNMMKKDKTAKPSKAVVPSKKAVKPAKKGKLPPGRKAAVGGSKSTTGAKNLNNEFTKLTSEIEAFLSKY